MKQNILVLFDIDGTLTPPRGIATSEILDLIEELRNYVYVGVVGGSDLIKQQEQLGKDVLNMFDYNFPENGLVAYKSGIQIHKNSIIQYLGEEQYKRLINYVLKYIADCDVPIKRGTFVELRTGLINISVIGRNCSSSERSEYEKYDIQYKIRKNLIDNLHFHFKEYNLRYAIGGQISFDVFPMGWDKTYCLNHVEDMNFNEIHFFGDKTKEGENDYEIYTDERVIGHHVNSPSDTIQYVKKMLSELRTISNKDCDNVISGGNSPIIITTDMEENDYLICKDTKGNVYKIASKAWHECTKFGFGVTELCPRCEITELEYDYCKMKDCDKCSNSVCMNCVAVTGCQTRWGICKTCFDYKCEDCKTGLLNKDDCYIIDDEPQPICDQCIKQKSNSS
jgi:phosphomannomutase